MDSIPSSANQEDHVSMGTIAARKAAQIVDHATHVLAMELLAACQGIDLRGPKRLGKARNDVSQTAEPRCDARGRSCHVSRY